jgi:AraC family transcriptional regulator
MLQTLTSPWPPAGVSLARISSDAGRVSLPAAFEHRILVHASPSTWSICWESGLRYLRRSADIDIVPAGEEGGYDAETPCHMLELRIPPGLLERVAEEAGRPAARSGLRARHVLKDERIAHLARALETERSTTTPAGRLFVDSIGVALATRLLGLIKPVTGVTRGLTAAQLQRVFDYVEAHLDKPLTLSGLSRIAGASSAQLRHWFKAQTGVTVHHYVVRRRVERARMLLLQRELKASEVALAAGFAHQSHMASWMRRELGQTPRELLGKK